MSRPVTLAVRTPFRASSDRVARLWLGALVAACSREDAPVKVPASSERSQAATVLREAARAAHVVVSDDEYRRSSAWLGRLGAAVEMLARDFAADPQLRGMDCEALAASALAWGAVSCWQDLDRAPWTRCAASCARLARKLEPLGADTLAPRMGDALRRAMDREADRLWLGYVRHPLAGTVEA